MPRSITPISAVSLESSRWQARLPVLTLFLGLFTLLAGLVSILGWITGIYRLTDWWGIGISIKANAALAGIAAGIALILLGRGARAGAAVISLGVFCALVGGITLFEHLTGWNAGIDTLLFDEPEGMRGTASPGRMGPPASVSFLLAGLAMIALVRGRQAPAALAAGVILAFGILSLTGYLYSAELMYSEPKLTGISVQAVLIIVAMGLGLLLAAPEQPPLTILLDDGAAGLLARKLLPFVVLVPVGLGWLRIQGEVLDFYDAAFGAALRTLIELALLSGLLWSALVRLKAHEAATLAALQAKERQLQHVTDNVPVLVAQCDRERRFVFVNRTSAGFLGRPIEDIVGRRVEEVLGECAYRTVSPFIDRVLQGEEVVFESEISYPGASARWMRGMYVPDRDAGGAVCGWIAALADITERKQAEEALKLADRRKDEFLAMLAHELRNPLAPVINSLELLDRARGADAGQREIVDIMRRQVAHIVRLVDDLLDVSRISSSKILLRKQRLELAPLLREALESVRPLAAAMGQRLVLELPEAPLYLEADEARLSQVFGNLLNNACRYTGSGGEITLSADRQGEAVEVRVRDTGTGIPADRLEDIFEMFSQVDRSLERTAGGLGIGLHLVRQLVGMHGGVVSAHSEGLGNGSEFRVRLPLAVGQDEPPPLAIPAEKGCPAARRILVVDDNRDAAQTLALLLELEGNATETAFDGVEALDKAARFAPEVILLDIGLPGLNGYDVCKALRRQETPGQRRFILALTGWGQAEDRRKSREAGFDGHLVKPVDHKTLSEMLLGLENSPA